MMMLLGSERIADGLQEKEMVTAVWSEWLKGCVEVSARK